MSGAFFTRVSSFSSRFTRIRLKSSEIMQDHMTWTLRNVGFVGVTMQDRVLGGRYSMRSGTVVVEHT